MEAEKTQQPVPIIAYAQGKMSKDETCGAFAVFIFKGGEPRHTIAWATDATFQYRIEVDAVCVALEQVEPNGSITIHTRSKHVQIGLERLLEWKAKGWKIPAKELGQAPRRVMNHDLWKRIDKVLTERTPHVNWVWEFLPENRDKECKNVHRHAKTLARKYAEELVVKRQSEAQEIHHAPSS